MLSEAEAGLVATLKAAPIAQYVRQVATLPDATGDTLVKRFAADAPAIYVTLAPFSADSGGARLRAAVVCVSRNAAGFVAARQGDGKLVGLYQMMDAVMGTLHLGTAGGALWEVRGGEFMDSAQVFEAGLQVGIVKLETAGPAVLPSAIDAAALGDFQTFHADYDIPPFTPAQHDAWLQEPPSHAGGAPDAADTTLLQEP